MPEPRAASSVGAPTDRAAPPVMAATETCGSARGPLGILAGGGQFPAAVADATQRRGRAVHVVGLDGFADRDLIARFPHHWIGLGQIDRMLLSFRRAGCRELIIGGSLQRPNLLKLKLDLGFFRFIPTVVGLTRGGDDSVLRRVVRFFEEQGFVVRGVPDVAPELLAVAGHLGTVHRREKDEAAIVRASRAIAALGAFDIGQAVVATDDRVVAVETARGTDAMLAEIGKGGAAAEAGQGGVLVKLSKPGQEMRIDLPAIGPVTAERAEAARLAGIAVGAGETVILEQDRLRSLADAAGLFVSGLDSVAIVRNTAGRSRRWTPDDIARLEPLEPLSRRVPTPNERRDITISRELIEVLRREQLGRACVVAREHALLVQGALPLIPLLAPLRNRSTWGLRFLRSQIGTLAIDLAGLSDEEIARAYAIELFRAARDARLAGIIALGRSIPDALVKDWAGWCNDAKLFLMGERLD